jgi:hypothetical protein
MILYHGFILTQTVMFVNKKALVVIQNQGLTLKEAKREYSSNKRLYSDIDDMSEFNKLFSNNPLVDILIQIVRFVNKKKKDLRWRTQI